MAEIRKKGPNKYLVLVFVGRDAEGKRIYERELFNGTEKQAKKWAAEWEISLKKRLGPNSIAMTVGEYLERKWLPGIRDSVSVRGYETYNYHVRRLMPLVGRLPMYNLSGMVLQDALPTGCFGNVKPKTVRGFYGTLKTAMRQAVAWGILAVDPTAGLRTPRVPKRKKVVLTLDQLVRLLEAAKTYEYYLVIRVLALVGGRLGEVLGLQWPDVDLKKGTLTIMRAADVRSRKETDDIKEEASQRTIKLDAETLTLLAALKRERKVVSMNGSSLVFNIGGRVLRANAVRISLNKSLKKAGLDHIRIHDLRHGAGSILLDTGKSLADVAEFLGHSSPATTAAAYTHAVRQGESIGNLLPK